MDGFIFIREQKEITFALHIIITIIHFVLQVIYIVCKSKRWGFHWVVLFGYLFSRFQILIGTYFMSPQHTILIASTLKDIEDDKEINVKQIMSMFLFLYKLHNTNTNNTLEYLTRKAKWRHDYNINTHCSLVLSHFSQVNLSRVWTFFECGKGN